MQVGQVKYNVVPKYQKYIHGICSMHVYEYETWDYVKGNLAEHASKYMVSIHAKNGNGEVIRGGIGDDWEWASDKAPYALQLYYDSLLFTPESQGGDYIQFQLGAQHWSTKASSDTAKCKVGGWDGDYRPVVSLNIILPESKANIHFLVSRHGLRISMLKGMDTLVEHNGN